MTGIEIIRDVSDSGMMLSSSGPYLRSTSNTLSACSLEHSRKCFSRLRNVLGSVHGDAELGIKPSRAVSKIESHRFL